MTEQEKREKVIRGLECCTKDECECCPYEDVCFGDDEVELFDTLARDALALLKAQEPVEPVPVVHARWDILRSEHYGQKWQADATCPLCDFMKYSIWSGFFPDVPANTARSITGRYARKVKLPNYCENCGAKMDGEANERREAAEGRT